MTDQYEEVTDYRKIIVIAGLIGAAILSFFVFSSGLSWNIPTLSNNEPTLIPPEEQQTNQQIIKKYLDYGLEEKTIVKILLADCSLLDNLVFDQKYDGLIAEKRALCQ